MKKNIIASVSAAIVLSATAGAAQAAPGDVTVGVGASLTQGFGLEVGYAMTESLTLRGAYYGANLDESEDIDGIDFDIELDMQNVGAFVDWKPMADSGFRVSVGVISNGNELTATSSSSNSYDIGNTTYTAAQVGTLTGEIGFDSMAPYLSLGYDANLTDNLVLGADLGVIFQGSPDVTYSATGALASDAAFLADLQREEDNAQSDIDDFKYLPVVKIALSYRF
ncbi:MAG: hypothetical protein ACPGF7_06390 [Pontibacterium sp.]